MTAPDGLMTGEHLADESNEHTTRRQNLKPSAPGRIVKKQRRASISVRRYSLKVLDRDALAYPEQPGVDYHRPTSRDACRAAGLGDDVPCPYASCSEHLYLNVNEDNGNIGLPHGVVDVDTIPETCALAVAERGPHTLEDLGAILGVSRERVRQLEDIVLAKVKAAAPELAEYLDGNGHDDTPVSHARGPKIAAAPSLSGALEVR